MADTVDKGMPEGAALGKNSSALVGFWGADPVAQQSTITAATTATASTTSTAADYAALRVAVNSVISALKTVGVVASS